MSQQQSALARHIMKVVKVPPFSAITDSALHNNIAFADQLNSKIHIDAKRKSFANTLVHECSYILGNNHNDGKLGMSYAVTQTLAGEIVEDQFLLLPELALHPALAQPLLPLLPIGVPVETQVSRTCSLL